MSRSSRFIAAAAKASREADPACGFRVGAVVVVGNRIIASGACQRKTHPRNPKLDGQTKRDQLCAETVALLRASHVLGEDMHTATVYVARTRKSGLLAMSKPCRFCRTLMRKLGIRTVFYTGEDGGIEKLEI